MCFFSQGESSSCFLLAAFLKKILRIVSSVWDWRFLRANQSTILQTASCHRCHCNSFLSLCSCLTDRRCRHCRHRRSSFLFLFARPYVTDPSPCTFPVYPRLRTNNSTVTTVHCVELFPRYCLRGTLLNLLVQQPPQQQLLFHVYHSKNSPLECVAWRTLIQFFSSIFFVFVFILFSVILHQLRVISFPTNPYPSIFIIFNFFVTSI